MAAVAQKNEIEFARQMTLRGLSSGASEAGSTTTEQAVAVATAMVPAGTAPTDAQELQTLKQVITAWRETEREVSDLSSQVREKKKKQKALEEMILRIMKKHNIGALDLKGSGGRLLYRRQTTKATLNPKTLSALLSEHLKSEAAAVEALKFIQEHRGARVRESLLYEKE